MEIYLLAVGVVLNSFGLVVTNIIHYKFTHKNKRRKRNVSTSKID